MSEDHAAPAQEPREDAPLALRGLRVLVVDGSEEGRRSLGVLLSSMGMQPTLRTQTQSAVEELRRAARDGQPYGLLLFDPTLRGSVAFRARRAEDDPLLAITPRIQLTADTSRDAAHAEHDRSLRRPLTREALLAAIERTLGRRGPAPRAALGAAPAAPAAPATLILRSDPVTTLLASRLVELTGGAPVVVDSLEEALAAVDGAAAVVLDAARPGAEPRAESLRRVRPALRVLGLDDLQATLEPRPDRAAPMASSPQPPPFDRAGLASRLGDDPEAAQRVLERFVDGADGYLHDLSKAAESGDADALRQQVHRIRGALSWIGAERAARIAADVEGLCRSGGADRAAALCPTLEHEIRRVLAAVRSPAGPGTG